MTNETLKIGDYVSSDYFGIDCAKIVGYTTYTMGGFGEIKYFFDKEMTNIDDDPNDHIFLIQMIIATSNVDTRNRWGKPHSNAYRFANHNLRKTDPPKLDNIRIME